MLCADREPANALPLAWSGHSDLFDLDAYAAALRADAHESAQLDPEGAVHSLKPVPPGADLIVYRAAVTDCTAMLAGSLADPLAIGQQLARAAASLGASGIPLPYAVLSAFELAIRMSVEQDDALHMEVVPSPSSWPNPSACAPPPAGTSTTAAAASPTAPTSPLNVERTGVVLALPTVPVFPIFRPLRGRLRCSQGAVALQAAGSPRRPGLLRRGRHLAGRVIQGAFALRACHRPE